MTVQTFLRAAQAAGLAHNSGAGGEFILVATRPQLEKLERTLQGDGGYVPGLMCCDGCKFELTRVSLNVNVGTVTAGDSEPEPCPNGCGPLRPVSWKQHATELARRLAEFFERATAAENKLAAGQWELMQPAVVKRTSGDFAPQQVWRSGTIVTRPDGAQEDGKC